MHAWRCKRERERESKRGRSCPRGFVTLPTRSLIREEIRKYTLKKENMLRRERKKTNTSLSTNPSRLLEKEKMIFLLQKKKKISRISISSYPFSTFHLMIFNIHNKVVIISISSYLLFLRPNNCFLSNPSNVIDTYHVAIPSISTS